MEHINYPKTEHVLFSKTTDLDSSFSNNEPLLILNNTIKNIINDDEPIVVIEEKMDGSGIGFWFEGEDLFIQQRGHTYSINNCPTHLYELVSYLKQNEEELYILLKNRYAMFGEWLYYKHTIFYDNLPSYFLEYDIYDKEKSRFLTTPERQNFLKNTNIHSVKVIDNLNSLYTKDLVNLIHKYPQSHFKTDNIHNNLDKLLQYSLVKEKVLDTTLVDSSYEGFYIKVESKAGVDSRHKWIRKSFIDKIISSEHWKKSPLITNSLSSSFSYSKNYKTIK